VRFTDDLGIYLYIPGRGDIERLSGF
jgi:hypothetical protein